MSFSSKHDFTRVYTKGRYSCGSCIMGSSALGTTFGASGISAFPELGSTESRWSARSYCGGKSYAGVQDRGRDIYGSLDGGPLGSGCACAPPGGLDCSSICFEHLGGGFGTCNEALLFSCGEKMTMQNLNNRLAKYLDKVQCLNEENARLEGKIRTWYDRQGPPQDPKDYSCYYQQTEDLKKQVICATMDNRKLALDIHNNQLMAHDFRMKYETELLFCQDVKADSNSLRQVLDQLTLSRSDLEARFESLQEELCCLKKNHEEEVKLLKNQTTGNFNVEVNSHPGSDLRKTLDDLRNRYEAITEKNRRAAEKWYKNKMEEMNQQATNRSNEVEDGNYQIIGLKRQLQTLEIDLQTQLSLRDTLEDSLAETQCRYNNSLAAIRNQISCVQQQLAELRAETECQNGEYRNLLDAKCLLEQEIEMYRCLLEGEQHDSEVTTDKLGGKTTSFTSRATNSVLCSHLTSNL